MSTLLEAKSRYQTIKITADRKYDGEIILWLDGLWQFGSAVEFKYHEGLLTIPMCAAPSVDRVLLCGAGDGLALRETLRFPYTRPTLVELDPGMIEVFRDMPEFAKYNNNSLKNSRCNLVVGDAIQYMAECKDKFDLVVWDFPSPGDGDDSSPIVNLYTKENIQKAIKCLNPHGVFAAQVSIPTTLLSTLVKEFMAQGFYIWQYDVYYDNKGNHDSIMVACKTKLKQERKIPQGCRFATEARIKSAFSAATEIIQEDMDYFLNFLHLESIEQDAF